MQKKYYWQPAYVDKFQCDGALCNAKCCGEWGIYIDDATIKRYKNIRNPEIRAQIIKNFKRDEENKLNVLIFNEQGRCPFVCKDHLCYIQRNLGEAFLSEICHTYPRGMLKYETFNVRFLSMACPVAARLALFSSDGMQIARYDEVKGGKSWQLLGKDISVKADYGADITENVILGAVSILQNNKFSFEERLVLLGLFLERADMVKNEEKADVQIANLAVEYQSEEFKERADKAMLMLKFDEPKHRYFVRKAFAELIESNLIGDMELLIACVEIYNDVYDKIHASLWDTYGKAIENYWVNEFLLHGYPFSVKGSFLDNYYIFILCYKVWEIIAYVYCTIAKRMPTKEEMIDNFGTFCTISVHKRKFIKLLDEIIHSNQMSTLDFVQALIRLR